MIATLPYLGPLYNPKEKERELIPLESNETASTVPSLFFDSTREGANEDSVQEQFRRIFPTLVFESDIALIRQIKCEVQDHLENRFQLFYQQLLMVYSTGMQYAYSTKALAQAGFKNKEATSVDLAEAHDSTLPCLLVEKDGKDHVFGAGSSFYNAQNMTSRLGAPVNLLDTWIDTTKRRFSCSFRDRAFTIIQENSEGESDPQEGMQACFAAFRRRLEGFEKTAKEEDSPKKLVSRFYTEVVVAYETLAEQGDTLIKSLSFAYRSKEAVGARFFLKIQKPLHEQLAKEMKLQERLHTLSISRPFSNTQMAYSKIYLTSQPFIARLRRYFEETESDTLVSDWNHVAQATRCKTDKLSEPLKKIFQKAASLISTVHGLNRSPHNLGFIMERLLFSASLSLSPQTAELYALSEGNRRRSTRHTQPKAQEIATLPAPTTTQRTYIKKFSEAEEVQPLIQAYLSDTPAKTKKMDAQNVVNITGSKMGAISEPLQAVAKKCVEIHKKRICGFGTIIAHLIQPP